MRNPHLVKPIHGNETPSAAIWFDTETDGTRNESGEIRHKLVFGWACYRRRLSGGKWSTPRWFRFTTPDEFWSWCVSRLQVRRTTYLFAHNTSFDLPVVDAFNMMHAREFEMVSPVIEAPPTIVKWVSELGTLKCLDTLNFFRMPLAVLGESVGLPKLLMPDNWEDADRSDAYCRRDVEIIMTAMLNWWDWIERDRLGGFAPTLAGQALRTYRARFMRHDLFAHANKDVIELERSAYYGGRVECWRIGRLPGSWHIVDVNSMFPWVMATMPVAHRYRYTQRRPSLRGLRDTLATHGVVARVRIDTDEPVYPARRALGLKVPADLYMDLLSARQMESATTLIFPVGRFTTTLSTPELEYALEQGHIHSVEHMAVYDTSILFSDYVDYFYTQRLNAAAAGDRARVLYCKVLLNALYGKFGQRSLHYEDTGTTPDLTPRVTEILDAATGERIRERQFGGVVQRLSDQGEAFDAVASIAGHITAGARMHLWRLAKEAGRHNVAYMDTDSLIVNGEGLALLHDHMDATRLGALKLERSADYCEVRALKEYIFGDLYKSKGVRRNALWLSRDTVEQDEWMGLKGLIARGDLSAPITRSVTKHLRRVYNKGRVTSSGRVVPLELAEW
jgi:hypothetical protein